MSKDQSKDIRQQLRAFTSARIPAFAKVIDHDGYAYASDGAAIVRHSAPDAAGADGGSIGQRFAGLDWSQFKVDRQWNPMPISGTQWRIGTRACPCGSYGPVELEDGTTLCDGGCVACGGSGKLWSPYVEVGGLWINSTYVFELIGLMDGNADYALGVAPDAGNETRAVFLVRGNGFESIVMPVCIDKVRCSA